MVVKRPFLSIEALEPRLVLSTNPLCGPCRIETFLTETRDNDPSTANDLGVIVDRSIATGQVSTFDRQDFYRFQLEENSNVDIRLDGHRHDVDLFLYDRHGQRLEDSSAAGSADELLTKQLELGEYFVQVRGYRHAGTYYRLTVQAHPSGTPALDLAGNTPLAAREVTGIESAPVFQDSITSDDPLDFYEVNIQQPGEVRFELSHHHQGLDLYVISAAGDMVGRGQSGEAGANVKAEALSISLSPGEYYALVLQTTETASPYDLTIAAVQSVPRRILSSQGAEHLARLTGSVVATAASKEADREAMVAAIVKATGAEPVFPWNPPDTTPVNRELPLAFPGAEGMGAYAQGGRGGDVYVVSNLHDSGVGSLRYGIDSATGPRTILFEVSGEIDLQSRLYIDKPYLTITGEKAPGEGITITGETVIVHDTHDVILRYLRLRPGDEHPSAPRTHDSITIVDSSDIMLDHMSLSWAIDEVFQTGHAKNITIQWSIISEPLVASLSPGGELGYAALSFDSSVSLHHNLIAHASFRMPRLTDGTKFDVVNNVIYNWSRSYPVSIGSPGVKPSSGNIENNVFIAGPSIGDFHHDVVFWGKDDSEVYFAGNILDGDLNGRFNPDTEIQFLSGDKAVFVEKRFELSHITIEPARAAYQSVLKDAGASAARDATDTRVVGDVENQTGGTIDSPSDVSGRRDVN